MTDIAIEAPDGSTVLFPAGTPDAEIEQAMRAEYGGPEQTETADPDPIRPETRGTILPIATRESGELTLDLAGSGITGFIVDVLTLPGDTALGKTPTHVTDAKTGETVINPDMIERAFHAATVLTPVPAGSALKRINPPSSKTLKNVGNKQFEKFRESGVRYRRQGIRDIANRVEKGMKAEGFSSATAPLTFGVLKKLKKAPTQPSPVQRLSGKNTVKDKPVNGAKMRQWIEEVQGFRKKEMGKHDGAGAERLIQELNTFVEKPKARDVIKGDAATAAKLHANGRQNIHAGKNATDIENKIRSAELKAARANSGQNVGNQLRSKAEKMVDPDRPGKPGFGKTPADLRRLTEVVEGTFTQNRLRGMGNRLGGGGGFGGGVMGLGSGGAAGATAGLITGNPMIGALVGGATTVGVPAAGAAMKNASSRSTKAAFKLIGLTMRMRSPLYRETVEKLGPGLQPAGIRAMLKRAGVVSAAEGVSDQKPLEVHLSADEREQFLREGP